MFRNRVMDIDLADAFSFTAKQTIGSLQAYIGEGKPNAAYAAMGYGFLNYARNALHVEKYYSNGVLDENFEVVGVRSEVALTRVLDLGKTQVARAMSVLDAKDTIPLLTVGAFEEAGVDRERGLPEKFEAIQNYSGQFIMARILAFVGGFPRRATNAERCPPPGIEAGRMGCYSLRTRYEGEPSHAVDTSAFCPSTDRPSSGCSRRTSGLFGR